jgi:hypothetical protein
MGELEQAARDLVDSANAGDEVAMATLHLVGENVRTGRMQDGSRTPLRAYVTHELAMRYAKSQASMGSDYPRLPQAMPRGAHEWLWKRAANGAVGDRPDLFGVLKGCDLGSEACVTAFAMGPRLTDKRIDAVLASFRGDPVGVKLAEKGLSDPNEEALPAILVQAVDGADVIEGCYFVGVMLIRARIRQCIVSGNFRVCRELCVELGECSPSECGSR